MEAESKKLASIESKRWFFASCAGLLLSLIIAMVIARVLVKVTDQWGTPLAYQLFSYEIVTYAFVFLIPCFVLSQLYKYAKSEPSGSWIGDAAKLGTAALFIFSFMFIKNTFFPTQVDSDMHLPPVWLKFLRPEVEGSLDFVGWAGYILIIVLFFVFAIKGAFKSDQSLKEKGKRSNDKYLFAGILGSFLVFFGCVAGVHNARIKAEKDFLGIYEQLVRNPNVLEFKKVAKSDTPKFQLKKAASEILKVVEFRQVFFIYRQETGKITALDLGEYKRSELSYSSQEDEVRSLDSMSTSLLPDRAVKLVDNFWNGKERYTYETYSMPNDRFLSLMGLMRIPTEDGDLILMLSVGSPLYLKTNGKN